MKSFMDLENDIGKNKIDNCYIMVGFNEELIKQTINKIKSKVIDDNFKDLNYFQFDGNLVSADEIINACETLPFMSEKKLVVVFRSVFLEDDGKQIEMDSTKTYNKISKYIENVPEHCILVMYYVFNDKRQKMSKKVRGLSKKCTVVQFELLRGVNLQRQVKSMFEKKKKNIGKVELSLFCNNVENNMDIINQEIEKLCCYAYGREITREDILIMLPQKSDDDIFNMVDFISQKRPQKSVNILNELMFRGAKAPYIISMIERQFKLLYNIKKCVNDRKSKDIIAKELRLNPYICEKMMHQSMKFTMEQLKNCLEQCIDVERKIKSSDVDQKMQLELLIIKSAVVK